ncbi:MAG: M20/M25/M40 family metallo-hydrolase [Verrucomicrobia bacterium]|nr:M20/M25/M40 family metallo-hydrolase [Verrucomicrobiota bacterium]
MNVSCLSRLRLLVVGWGIMAGVRLIAQPAATAAAEVATRATDTYLEGSRGQWEALARTIWDASELALDETKSSAALAAVLEKEGFAVVWGAGGQPTAFVATAGTGSPVVGLLAEYDALPSLSQAAGVTKKQALVAEGPGHGCGHNLLGSAAVAAAVATNRERVARKLPGTIKLFGTPAEEAGFGKTFMARDGAFTGTDVMLAWHPDLMLFDHALALMREHIRPTARLHRVVNNGGAAANIIPDYTRGQYWARDASGEAVNELLVRMRKAGEGAAMATETTVKFTLRFSMRDPLPNDALNRSLQRELDRVGAPVFDAADAELAKGIQRELNFSPVGMSSAAMPYLTPNGGTASSDIGEVAAMMPLAELGVAVRPLGTPAHHWAQTTCAASPIGYKGMLVAAKVLAATGLNLLTDAKAVQAAKDEFAERTKDVPYVSPLAADAKPRRP